MLRRFPLYPILFSTFPVLSLAAYNIDEISLDVIPRPLLAFLLAGLLLFGVAKLIFRDWHRAALAVFVIFIFFFIYGQVYNIVEDVTIGDTSLFRHRTLLPLFLLLLLISLVWVFRRTSRPNPSPYWLNLLSIALLVYPVFQIASNTIQQWSAERSVGAASPQTAIHTNQPDIYYIILDAYGRADVLQGLLGYDNSDFLRALRQRGFYVADCSQANYAYTEFSLTSSLNYDYLDQLDVSHSRAERIALLKHSAIRSFLDSEGYEIVAFPTGWTFTEWKDADLYVDYQRPVTALTEFEHLVLDTTMFRVVSDFHSSNQADASHKDLRRLRVFSLLENIKKLPGRSGNVFVFAHIVVPHLPYTFGPNGEVPAFQGKDATYEEIAAAYVDQVKFVNKEILKVIDTLIESADVPPVIIVQGDHGPLPDLTENPAERLPILNAYYLPDVPMADVLYPSISPVNSFRVVLSSYFEQNLPLLEDRSYFGPEDDRNANQLIPNTCIT
ncbi:MAG TPA: sulfatase-like hydrolase/transferase [Anaerolineales bacterium]|nr:sulfatase-like hydrolase/transferase [Anaerolineales bacterium]